MNKIKAIEILTDIIYKSDREKILQGKELYKSALIVLQNENSSEDDLRNLYRNFCGYLAHGEFTNSEYQEIKRLIDCLEK